MNLKTSSPSTKVITLNEPLLGTQCELGEGPIWDPRTQTLHFIDILNPRLYHYHPDSGQLEVEETSEPIGCLSIRKAGGLACAAKSGFGIVEPPTSPSGRATIRYLCKPLTEEYMRETRFNDGGCDAKGRFWAGTLEFTLKNGERRPGQLWRFDPASGEATMVDDQDLTDPNGLGWSADHKTMYFTNSTINVIHAYDYDDGEATNRRKFIDGNDPAWGLDSVTYGLPDGICIDKEASIWSARWEGSRVVRFTPDGKKVDLEIHIPKAYNVTACCFGGPDLDRLYITTASCFANRYNSKEENTERQKQFPHSGDLFVVDFSNLPPHDAKVLENRNLGPGIGGAAWRHEFPL